MRKSMMFAVLAVSFAGFGTAQAADQARAERLVEATGIEQNFVQMQQQMMQGAAQTYMMGAQERGLDEGQAASGRPAMESVFQEVQQVMSWEAMKPGIVSAYADIFSDAEIDAAIAFYTSAEGRAFLDKQPQLMERGSQLAQQRMEAAMPRIQAGIEAALESAAASSPSGN